MAFLQQGENYFKAIFSLVLGLNLKYLGTKMSKLCELQDCFEIEFKAGNVPYLLLLFGFPGSSSHRELRAAGPQMQATRIRVEILIVIFASEQDRLSPTSR